MGSINNAIDNSVPAVKAMNTAYEMAIDAGNTELANMIKKDLSAVKIRLDSGKDLNFVKDMQNKYSKFMPTEGLAYESKLAIMLNQRIK
jgi:formiminotetrahydrofolate cyclodeaminase